jgi:hypothetical protein
LIDEKNRGSKISWDCPFNKLYQSPVRQSLVTCYSDKEVMSLYMLVDIWVLPKSRDFYT